MLRINLLPAYIYERRKVRAAAIGFTIAFVAVLAGMLAWWLTLSNRQKELAVMVADMEAKAAEVTRIEQQAQQEENRIPVIQAKVDFIEAVLEYNLQIPKLYEEIAKYTYGRIQLKSMQASGGTVQIQAHARTLGDCGRYLMNMYRATHLFSSVTISGVPGWPAGAGGQAGQMVSVGPYGTSVPAPQQPSADGQGFDFNVTCTMVQQISPPVYGGAGAAPANAATAGAPGVPLPPGGAAPGALPPPPPQPGGEGAGDEF